LPYSREACSSVRDLCAECDGLLEFPLLVGDDRHGVKHVGPAGIGGCRQFPILHGLRRVFETIVDHAEQAVGVGTAGKSRSICRPISDRLVVDRFYLGLAAESSRRFFVGWFAVGAVRSAADSPRDDAGLEEWHSRPFAPSALAKGR